MHDILMSIILGIVEGFSEFLPISSTGHLLVAEQLLGLGDDWESFTIIIQLGAILAVVVYYFKTFWTAIVTLPTSAHSRRWIRARSLPPFAARSGRSTKIRLFSASRRWIN